MDESKKIFYENVIPSVNNKTVDIKFKDSNDLILDEKKKRKYVRFDKKLLKNIINTLFDFSYYTV